jgi:MoaA/NifB/PqqE/SkfB family radical SAM enzyme
MSKISGTPLAGLLGLQRQRGSYLRRALGLFLQNPGVIRTFLREEYRALAGMALDRRLHPGVSGLPVEIVLDLTRRCNLKCVMCTQIRHFDDIPEELSWYDHHRELPLAAWVDLLDQIKSFRPRLHLTGGEPTVYPGFADLVREIKQRGFLMRLTTNGTRLAQLADLLVSRGVEVVVVSLDGPEALHDRIRGQQGVFRRATEGIRALLAAAHRLGRLGPVLTINCTISRSNLEVLEQMVPLALDLGADFLQIHHTFFNSPANVARHNRLFSPLLARLRSPEQASLSISEHEYYQSEIRPADLPVLQASLQAVRRRAQGRINLLFVPNIPWELIEPYYLDLNYPFPPKCNRLWKSCRIFPDGTVDPCFHVFAGNITRQPFQEIWNSPKMQKFRKIIDKRLLPGCARCCSRGFT